jgi:hypothetical protein
MKFAAVLLLAFVAAATAGPISVSDNNIGDIVTVGINANAQLSNQIDQDIVNVIVALLNQQGAVVVPPKQPESPVAPEIPVIPETPDVSV